jgi:hypothetical protein
MASAGEAILRDAGSLPMATMTAIDRGRLQCKKSCCRATKCRHSGLTLREAAVTRQLCPNWILE